ncbi:hypothetical protein FF38_11698 [Lucilia cuprina]|uniref:Ionotropic glutamate receptor L-glutamate and glycine-binding domain-containing protein n=1 Tax=Lucilia cuprina TaxID=7375 RepID=A0A0L0CEK7_LUCCU|nr:hypothetical protein FF38_11698 [Lucilia cuprina]
MISVLETDTPYTPHILTIGTLLFHTTLKEISFDLISEWLQKPISNLPHNFQMKVIDDIDNQYIHWFLHHSKLPLTISTYLAGAPESYTNYNLDNYVILSDVNQLQMTAKQFAQTAGAYFFVINGGDMIMLMKEIRETLHYMWSEFLIYNIYLLTEEVLRVKNMEKSLNTSMEQILFSNMRGYPLRVQMFKSTYSHPIIDGQTNAIKGFKGVDGRVASLLQQYLNFTLILQEPDPSYFGSRLPNGSFSGAIGSAINKQLDVCLTGFFVKDYLTTGIAFSVVVYDDKLCIYTQKAKQISNSVSPLFSLNYKVWICFVLMAFVCSVIWFILRTLNIWLKITPDKSSRRCRIRVSCHYMDLLINTWMAWIRHTLLRNPPFANERMLVASICLCSVILGAILECSFSTVYIHPLYFNDITTLKALDESDFKILFKHRLIADDLFFSETSLLFPGVSRYKTLMMDNYNMIVSKHLWVIPECPKQYSLSYIWPKEAPWSNAINNLLLRFLCSGLIHKFEDEMKNEVDIKIMKEHLFENIVHFKVVTLSDLQLAFYVLFFGNFVALMCSKITKGLLVLLIYSIHCCKSLKTYTNLSSITTSKQISMVTIESWLRKPLVNVKHLHLKLRSNHFHQDVENSYTQWFLQQTLVPITICKYELIENKTNAITTDYSRHNYVIATSMTDLRLTARQFGKRAGIFFFIVNGVIDFKELHNIFYLGWKRLYIFKSFVLTDKGVLMYDPFALDKYGNYGKVIQYTGKETIERTIFYNMRGYPLRVQLFKSVYSKPIVNPITNKVESLYGVDGKVANLLQKHMNFTMNLQSPDRNYFGQRSPNGTYNGVIGSIVNNELDLCVTGFFVKDYMVPEMDFSVAVYDDKLCIYTPKAKKIPESIVPIFAVRYDLWIGFIFMAFVCSFFWALLRVFNLHLNTIQIRGSRLRKSFLWQYVRILIDTWVVWVRVNITQYPPFNSERVFIASLCLISVIFGAIFESSLATVYIHPIYYNDIHTLQELDDSGLNVEYKYSSMGDDLFFSETSPLFASLNKKLRFINDLYSDIVEDVALNGGKAGVTRYTTLMMQSLHFIVSKQLWIVPECPKYYAISYVWPKDAPWDETINRLLLRIQNAGLINKFIAEMQTDVDIQIMKDRLYETHQGYKVLTIEDLQLAFYVCIWVHNNIDFYVFNLVFNMDIPLSITHGWNYYKKHVQTPLCPHLITQIKSADELKPVLDNCATQRGIMFILLNQNIDFHEISKFGEYYWRTKKIYRVFYITTEHAKFYHPFITCNNTHGAMVDTRDHNIKNILHNLHGYPMRVYIFDSVFSEVKAKCDTFNVTGTEGVDAKVAYLLEKLFNFNMQLQWPDDDFFGARLENGSFNGALGRMIRNETDITMTGFFVKDYLTRDVHFSVSVYMDKLCCYVMKSKRIPQSILPLYAVDESIWLVYLTVGLFSSLVWMFLRRLNLCIGRSSIKRGNFKTAFSSSSLRLQYLNIFKDTWILWVRMIIVRFPPYNAERIFAISLCLVSVIIGALLESSLATVYIRPRYYKDINSLEDLEKANLKIFIKHAAMRDDLFRGQNSRLYNSLDERVMLVGEPEERLISIMSKRGGFVAVTREFSLLIADIYYFITKKIHIIPECPKTYHIAYLFSKDSPYEETFNVALLRFLAAGLIQQWIDESRHEALCQIHNFDDYIAESTYQWKAFEINDLQLAFYALILGNICAAILFLVECIVHKKLFRKIKLFSH